MAENERLWYRPTSKLGEKIIDDEANYGGWVTWAKGKKNVKVTREAGDIVEGEE